MATSASVQMEEDRAAAIQAIDSAGFAPTSFTSSAAEKVPKIALPGESDVNGFQFGTAAERSAVPQAAQQAAKFLAQIDHEGLCHPNWFIDPKERQEKWTKHLFALRQKLVKERRAQKD
jgi:hypothetical protein